MEIKQRVKVIHWVAWNYYSILILMLNTVKLHIASTWPLRTSTTEIIIIGEIKLQSCKMGFKSSSKKEKNFSAQAENLFSLQPDQTTNIAILVYSDKQQYMQLAMCIQIWFFYKKETWSKENRK